MDQKIERKNFEQILPDNHTLLTRNFFNKFKQYFNFNTCIHTIQFIYCNKQLQDLNTKKFLVFNI